MKQEEWDDLYPEGFRSSFSMRHMPKTVHRDLHRISGELEKSVEYVLIMCTEVGIREITRDIFSRG